MNLEELVLVNHLIIFMIYYSSNFVRREFCRKVILKQFWIDHKMKAEMTNFVNWIGTEIFLCGNDWDAFSAEVAKNKFTIL
jgi:hypothetical protein